MPSSIEAELRTALTTIQDLVQVLTSIKRSARTIVEGKVDALTESARIVLLAEQAIFKTTKACPRFSGSAPLKKNLFSMSYKACPEFQTGRGA